jgi:hypothetical protein
MPPRELILPVLLEGVLLAGAKNLKLFESGSPSFSNLAWQA